MPGASADMVELVRFKHAPYPYVRTAAERQRFYDVIDGKRRGHTGRDGTVYWEDETYQDNRVLLAIPASFDPKRRPVLVVYLHGNQSQLLRDVRDRQRVPAQIAAAKINALVLAPQFAVDALDSGAGKFAKPGAFARFLDEGAEKMDRLLRLYLGRQRKRPNLRNAPVILVAYSGGYAPAAAALSVGHANPRIRGVVLLDAVYGSEPEFSAWIGRHRASAFVFSAYTESTRVNNELLQSLLRERQVPFTLAMPRHLAPGAVHFLPLGSEVEHVEFLTQAWTANPLTDVLRRVSTDIPRKVVAKKTPRCQGRYCKVIKAKARTTQLGKQKVNRRVRSAHAKLSRSHQ